MAHRERAADAVEAINDDCFELACLDVGQEPLQCWALGVAPREPAIGMDGLERDPIGPAFALDGVGDLPGRLLAGSVLTDRHLRIRDRVDFPAQRPEAIDREIGGAIANDDDKEIHVSQLAGLAARTCR